MLWLKHLRDIIILPFSMTCIVPVLIHNPSEHFIPNKLAVKVGGLILALSGFLLFLYTVFLFNRYGKGTLAPWSNKVKLVVSGPYRYCRNPMITGVWTILVGESLFFHSTSILIWSFAFFLINTVYFILIEEPALSEQFGSAYKEYKRHVPRWIPRPTPYRAQDE
jgi:protein-S-isoprenylcysteine O-methyltransferase Ste14